MSNLVFKYSRIYNTNWKRYFSVSADISLPSFEDILEQKSKLEEYWKINGAKIMNSISNISGLKWKDEDINVYLIAHGPVFSDPLTLSLSKGKESVNVLSDEEIQIDLIHELIHNILSQNHDELSNFSNWRDAKYGEEDILTRVHIAVHAIEVGVMTELKREKELEKIIMKSSGSYRKAWDILEQEGWENIVKYFTFNK